MSCEEAVDWPNRWSPIQKLLENPGPFSHSEFEESPEVTQIKRFLALKIMLKSK